MLQPLQPLRLPNARAIARKRLIRYLPKPFAPISNLLFLYVKLYSFRIQFCLLHRSTTSTGVVLACLVFCLLLRLDNGLARFADAATRASLHRVDEGCRARHTDRLLPATITNRVVVKCQSAVAAAIFVSDSY